MFKWWISMMNKCVKVWRTLFIIYVCGILIILYEQQWFRPTHSYQWWSRRYITNLRLYRRSGGVRITVVRSSWKSLLLKIGEIKTCFKGKSLGSPKKEIIEMRTRLKHAENGAKSGKPESVQNQSENILSRLSPQKLGVANKLRGWGGLKCLMMWGA